MASSRNEALLGQLQALAQNPKSRPADILPHTRDEDPAVRAAALAALWNHPGGETLEVLIGALEDAAPEVQAAAAATLGRYIWSGMQLDSWLDEQFGLDEEVKPEQVERASELLQKLVGEPGRDRQVRLAALEALAWDPDERVHREIEALWRLDDRAAQMAALRCMGRTASPRWRQVILEALSAGDAGLLRAAVEAAGEGCIEAAEGRLLELTQSQDRALALEAIWALRNVIHTQAGRKALEKLARGKDPELKAKAKATLQELDAIDVEERPDEGDDD